MQQCDYFMSVMVPMADRSVFAMSRYPCLISSFGALLAARSLILMLALRQSIRSSFFMSIRRAICLLLIVSGLTGMSPVCLL